MAGRMPAGRKIPNGRAIGLARGFTPTISESDLGAVTAPAKKKLPVTTPAEAPVVPVGKRVATPATPATPAGKGGTMRSMGRYGFSAS